MTLSERMEQKMYDLEMRMVTSSFWAGAGEVALRFITGIEFFGYLGTGLILYGIFHYAQLRRGQQKKKTKVM